MSGFDLNNSLISAYFTTNINPNDPSSASNLPSNTGRFNQDFSAMKTSLQQKFGTDYEIYLTCAQTFFLQKEVLDSNQAPYEVFIGYTDNNGDTWTLETIPSPSPVRLPWVASANSFMPQNLYILGDARARVSPYVLQQSTYGTYDLLLVPQGTPADGEIPANIFININVHAAVQPGQLGGSLPNYFLLGYSINNTVYPSVSTQAITIQLPYWLRWPYWVQQIVATENQTPATYAPALGGWPLTNTPMKQFLFQNDQAILNTDGTKPDGTPSCFVQIELSVLDIAYVGNQSNGNILQTITFTPFVPNEYLFQDKPTFYQQTRQAATSLIGTSSIQFGVTDRKGNPFLSLLAAYNVTSQVIVEAKRRTRVEQTMTY